MEERGGGRGTGRLAGKTAIITGAGSGIGRETAILFVEQGATVAAVDLDEAGGQETLSLLEARLHQLSAEEEAATTKPKQGAFFCKANVAVEEEIVAMVEQVVQRTGRIDVLVNNAAAFVFGTVDETSAEDWDKVLGVNVKGTALVCKHVIRQMKQQDLNEKGSRGSIVNLASVSSYIAQRGFVPYNTSKAAILGLTRCIAADVGTLGIRVNSVAPGTIDTPATRRACAAKGYSVEELNQKEGPLHVLGRIGQPMEVAQAILFLASDEASFVTATNLMVDGGFTAF
ncbi:Dihydroanticapsin 7-dehydrogenase [Balamuthia mandrillaris]